MKPFSFKEMEKSEKKKKQESHGKDEGLENNFL